MVASRVIQIGTTEGTETNFLFGLGLGNGSAIFRLQPNDNTGTKSPDQSVLRGFVAAFRLREDQQEVVHWTWLSLFNKYVTTLVTSTTATTASTTVSHRGMCCRLHPRSVGAGAEYRTLEQRPYTASGLRNPSRMRGDR